MSPDVSRKAEAPGSNAPTAALTDLKVVRRRKTEPPRKRGDLTATFDAETAADQHRALPHIELFHQRQLAGPVDPPREAEDPIDLAPIPHDPEPAFEEPEEPDIELAAEPPPQLALPAPPPSLYLVPPTGEPEEDEAPVLASPRESEAPQEHFAGRAYGPHSDEEIIDYWDSLRGDRALPLLGDLDRDWIARCWPNSLVLAVGEAEATSPRITRLGEARDDVEFTPMVIEWILARGRQSARRGLPIEEEQRFPVSRGSARYRLIMLPLGNEAGRSNHVLCRVFPTQDLSAAAAFKRWLAS